MGRNLVFTLAYNLVSETEAAVKRLYDQNDRGEFTHTIYDCGFPLLEGDKIPENIEEAKVINSQSLKELAVRHGSFYVKISNIGVSQNWTQAYNHFGIEDDDIMITCEPDEIQNEDGWVKAMCDVLRADESVAYCAPTLFDHIELLKTSPYAIEKDIAGYKIYMMFGNINYGQIAIKGSFLNKMGGVPVPDGMSIYGGLETPLHDALAKFGMRWGILKDFTQHHTNVPKLLRDWKDVSIFRLAEIGRQMPFEEYLGLRKRGLI